MNAISSIDHRKLGCSTVGLGYCRIRTRLQRLLVVGTLRHVQQELVALLTRITVVSIPGMRRS